MHSTSANDEATDLAPPGLRERKRTATRRRVEQAAIELSLKHGVENVTVDQICEASDISARTFFNYFGSKENAVIGMDSKAPSKESIKAFIAGLGGSVLEDFLVLISKTFAQNGPDVALLRARRELLVREPQLGAAQFARMSDERAAFIEIVKSRIAATEPSLPDAEVAEEALLVVGIAMGALHVIGHQWFESSGTASLEDLAHQLLPRLRRVTEPSRRALGA